MKKVCNALAAGLLLAALLASGGCRNPSDGDADDMRGFAPDPFSIPLGAEERVN